MRGYFFFVLVSKLSHIKSFIFRTNRQKHACVAQGILCTSLTCNCSSVVSYGDNDVVWGVDGISTSYIVHS